MFSQEELKVVPKKKRFNQEELKAVPKEESLTKIS
jgi:hypothetical protein